MIAINYNHRHMTGLSMQDYETLVFHLTEQVVACMGVCDLPEGEDYKTASDALNNEWSHDITAREWLARVGGRLGIDTSECVGA